MYYFSFSCNKDEYNHITRIRRHIGLGCQYILYKTAFLSKVDMRCMRMRVFPVTWQRWRSHHSHSIRRSREARAALKLGGSIFYRTGVIAECKFYIAAIGNFALFAAVSDLDLMTFACELDPNRVKMSRRPKIKFLLHIIVLCWSI